MRAAPPGATRRPIRRTALTIIAATLGTVAPLAATYAQGIATAPPPIRSSVDGNGVDLVTGALVVAAPQLSIGTGEGALTYTRNLTATGWVDNTIGTINVNGSAITVSFGGASDSFTLSGGVYTNALGGGSTLTYSSGAQQYTYTTATGVVVIFNAALPAYSPSYANGGRPITATYPDGMAVTYTYQTVTVSGTSASRLQSVGNTYGYQLKFTYANNSPASVSDLVAWTTIASVNAINSAVEYCSPSASTCTLVNSWPTVAYTSAVGPPATVTVTDPVGNKSVFTYSASNQLVGIQRPSATANTTGVFYNANGQVQYITNSAKVVGPGGSGPGSWGYAYALSGSTETTTVNDPLGHTRVVVSNTTSDLVSSDTDGLSRTTDYQYDSYGRLHQTTWPEGNYAVYAYDARGNLTSITTYPSSGSGTIVTSAAFDTTCTQPSKCNSPNTTTDGNRNITNYAYSPTTGQLTSVTGPPPTTGAVQPSTQFSYTSLYAWYIQASGGSVAQAPTAVSLLTGTSTCQTTASCSGTPDQVKSTIAHGTSGVANNLGPTSVTSASGTGTPTATVSQAYDNYGNVTSTVGALGSAQTSVYFHDLNRDLLGVIGPLASGQTTYPTLVYTWSPNGQVTEIAHGTSPNQSSLSSVTVLEQQNIAFDALGRQVQASFASGGTTQTFSQWTYDNANRLVCAAVRMNPSTFASEPASACVQGTAGSYGPDRISYEAYDAASELIQVTLGYLTPQQISYATYTYTANGYVDSAADAKDNLTTYIYDGYDQLVEIEYPSPTTPGSSNPSDYETFAYDGNNNVTVHRRRGGDTVTYVYDALNRGTSATFSANAAANLAYSYDLLNRPLSVGYSTAGMSSLAYGWDALSRLSTETIYAVGQGSGARTMTYGYDAAGDRTSITWPDTGANALTAIYAYDTLQRVTSIQANGTTITAYGYDQYGRRSSITRNGGSGAGTSYSYDGADRISSLVQSLSGSAAVTWTLAYDPSNALITREASNTSYLWHPGAASEAYTTNGLNQYTAITGLSASYNGANTAALTRDPAGRLLTKTAAGVSETFLYAGSMLVGEYATGTGAILGRYIPGPGQDEAALWYSGAGTGTPQWLHADAQGSTIAWSNGTGGSLGTQAYDPYGLPQSWSGPRYAYTGQLMIAETLHFDYKARAYDPTLGRFLQTDPAGYQSDINPYAYVGGDPVNGVDPSGMVLEPGFYCNAVYGSDNSVTGNCGWSYEEEDGPVPGSPGLANGGPSGNSRPSKLQASPLSQIKQVLCALVPSGKVAGVSGSIGGIGSTVVGGGLIQNYKSGQVSAFGFGGLQLGWNGGLNGSIFGGYVWGNLNNSNTNYSGGAVAVSGSVGPAGGTVAGGGGLVTVAGTAGGSLTPGTGTVSGVKTTPVVQIGKIPPLTPLDQAIADANQVCR